MELVRFGVLLTALFLYVPFCIAGEQNTVPVHSMYISQPEIFVNGINNSQVNQLILTKDLQPKKSASFGSLLKYANQFSGGSAAKPTIEYVKALDDHQGLIPRGSGLAMKLGSLKSSNATALTYADISAHATIDASWIGINVGW